MPYDNTNRGVLFANAIQKSERSPQLSGTLNVGGVEYTISAWKRKSKKDVRYLSLTVRPKQAEQPEPEPPADDSDIPF